MRKLALISAFLLICVLSRSQDFYVSPGYYPADQEMSLEWTPVASSDDIVYGSALPTWWEKNQKGIAVIGIQVASIILDAAGDAVYDMGKELGNSSQMFWGHTLQAAAIGSMGVTMASLVWEGNIWDGVRFGVSYIAMRYAIFDMTYNITRGIDPLYADGIKAKMPPGGRAFTQTIMFGFSISFNICEF